MNLEPFVLEHGERYGKLTVLYRVESERAGVQKYKVGCVCGYRFTVRRWSGSDALPVGN